MRKRCEISRDKENVSELIDWSQYVSCQGDNTENLAVV